MIAIGPYSSLGLLLGGFGISEVKVWIWLGGLKATKHQERNKQAKRSQPFRKISENTLGYGLQPVRTTQVLYTFVFHTNTSNNQQSLNAMRLQSLAFFVLLVLSVVCLPASVSARNTGMLGAHWGSYLVPESEPTFKLSLNNFLLSEYGQQPRIGPTRRGHGTLAPKYGTLDQTYGMTALHAAFTSNLPVASDILHPHMFFTFEAGVGATNDPIPSFLQNQFIHNSVDARAVARDDSASGGYATFGLQTNYFFGDEYWQEDDRESPLFLGGGLSYNSWFSDVFINIGIAELNPIKGSIDRYLNPRISWLDPDWLPSLTLHSVVRAGYVSDAFTTSTTLHDVGLPGLRNNQLNEFYLSYQAGAALDIMPCLSTTAIDSFLFRMSFTGTTGIFTLENADNLADKEEAIPERFVSYYWEIGNFWGEIVNDLQGKKDRGPSYGAQMGYRWEL